MKIMLDPERFIKASLSLPCSLEIIPRRYRSNGSRPRLSVRHVFLPQGFGAYVYLAARNVGKGEAAAAEIRKVHEQAKVRD